jgi:hypothetical protein
MGALTDTKAKFVELLQTLPRFSGDKSADVYAWRALDPASEAEQRASKQSGLAAFVSVDRVQRGSEDYDPAKATSIIIDLWVNVWAPMTEGSPADEHIVEAENLLEDIIRAVDGFQTSDSQHCRLRASFQDAFRVETAPKPYLVYRIITKTNTIISNN